MMTEAHDGWTERESGSDDVPRILELRRVAFPEDELDKLDPAFWKWEFQDGPAGPAVIHVGEVEGDFAAHVAVIPARWRIAGRDTTVSISVDVMTHPRHRRKKIFATLLRNTLLAAGRRGIPFTYVFVIREASRQGALGIGFEELMTVPVVAKPISFRRVLARWLRHDTLCLLAAGLAQPLYRLYCLASGRPRADRWVTVRETREFDERFTRFFDQASAPHEIVQIRDAAYLTWRYLRNPFRSYRLLVAERHGELVGFAALRRCKIFGLQTGMFVDLLCLPGDTGASQKLLQVGEDMLRSEGVDLVGHLCPREGLYWSLLRRNGYLKSPYAYSFIVHVNRSDFAREAIWDPRKWFVSWGDTDVM
jgi:GNAT superfamily N-acetyltransferase